MEIIDGRITGTTDGHYPQYFIVATEAEKPTNPGLGDICRVTATTKEYSCFVTNLWSLTNSPCKEVYYNHSGGGTDGVNNAYTAGLGASTTVAPHMRHLGAGDGVNNYGSWVFEIYINSIASHFTWSCKLGPITAGTGGAPQTFLGMADDYTTPVTDKNGVYFLFDYDGLWYAQSVGPGGVERVQITAPVDGDDLVILGQITRHLFFINGVLVANIANNLDANTLFPVAVCCTPDAAGTAQRLQRVDFMSIEVMK
jgi:hypothetical protein